MHIFRRIFQTTIDGRNLICCHKLHIGMRYCGKRFWTRQIPTSCLPTFFVLLHIEHIYTFVCLRSSGWGDILFYLCPSVRPKLFFDAFFSATIDGKHLIFGRKLHVGMPYCGKRFWTRQIPTSCLPT